jgi:hypothetical protein
VTTFSIIAIPFLALAVPMLVLGVTTKKPVFLILGGVFMSSGVVNALIGYTVSP